MKLSLISLSTILFLLLSCSCAQDPMIFIIGFDIQKDSEEEVVLTEISKMNNGSYISADDATSPKRLSEALVQAYDPSQVARGCDLLPVNETRYYDDFSDPRTGWPRYSTQDVSFYYENGQYNIDIYPDDSNFIAVNNEQDADDFALGARAAREDGTEGSVYGLVFRYSDKDNFYRFTISNEGMYKFDGLKEGSRFTVIDWTKSIIIRKGNASNLLQLTADGSRFAFYINRIKVAEVFDDTHSGGLVGLYGETNDGGNAHFSFDDFKIWSLIPYQPFGSISVGDIMHSDDFSVDEGKWANYTNEDVEFVQSDGRYTIKVTPENAYFYSARQGTEISDFVMEVEAAKAGGYDPVAYGAIFRYIDDDNFYRFSVSNKGYFRFDKKDGGTFSNIIDWTESDAILGDDSTNIIQIMADGEKFNFYINGMGVAEAYDSSIEAGGVGLIAQTIDGNSEATASFDRFRIWSLKNFSYGNCNA
jgi:hypothetical protein